MTRFMILTKYDGCAGRAAHDGVGPRRRGGPPRVPARLNAELAANGELVEMHALTGPDLAKIVTADGAGAPVVTDGPFPEAKELLAGYQMVDVESEERALEIAAAVSAAPGPGGVPLGQQIEVRQVMFTFSADCDGDRGRSRTCCAALAPQVLGVLVRRYGDFAAAEDAVQEALIIAAEHWARDGVPEHPHAWLIRTATRKLVDEHRAAAARRRREESVALEPPAAPVPDDDDTLRLLVLCCHPVLTPASAIALTLRAVGGLTTARSPRRSSCRRRRWAPGSAGPRPRWPRPARASSCRSPTSAAGACRRCCGCST